jgi:hypothetical protein
MRLVSLLPSATEIVYALGPGGQLVGVTFEYDEPPSARADKAVVVGGVDTQRAGSGFRAAAGVPLGYLARLQRAFGPGNRRAIPSLPASSTR